MFATSVALLAAIQLVAVEPPRGGGSQGTSTSLSSKPGPKNRDCVSQALIRDVAASGLGDEMPELLVVKFAVRADASLSRFEIVEGEVSEPAARVVWTALKSCEFVAAVDVEGHPTPSWVQIPLRFQPPPPPWRPTGTQLVAMSLAILIAFLAAGWWLGRRLGLFGPAAPPRSGLDPRGYRTRSVTRALFVLNFAFMLPAGVYIAVASVLVGVPWWRWVPPTLSTITLGAPLVILVRQIRRDDAHRLAGLPPAPTFADRYYGSPGVALHFRKLGRASFATWLAILGCTLAAWWLPAPRLLDRLLKANAAILEGQVWRLWTMALVHADARHLIANLSALLPLGLLLERLAGARAFLLVFLGGTASASVASLLLLPADSVGASGGVLAVVGALAAFAWRRRDTLPGTMRKVILWEALVTVALSLLLPIVLPFIDWAAHLGGFAAGLLLGWWLPPSSDFLAALASPAGPPPAEAPMAILSDQP